MTQKRPNNSRGEHRTQDSESIQPLAILKDCLLLVFAVVIAYVAVTIMFEISDVAAEKPTQAIETSNTATTTYQSSGQSTEVNTLTIETESGASEDDVTETMTDETVETEETVPVTNVQPSISAYGPSDGYYYHISDNEFQELQKLVYVEARGESFTGQVAVAAVVLNRFSSSNRSFAHTSIHDVIVQKTQFASISNITMDMVNRYPQIAEAVDQALRGYDPTRVMFPNGAYFFYAPGELTEGSYQYNIRVGIDVLPIGNHNFHVDFAEV